MSRRQQTGTASTKHPRLLSINNYNYRRGGAEVVYAEHNRLLTDAGWDVGCFAMQHPKNDPDPNDDLFVEEIEFGNDYGLSRKILNASRVIYSFEARRKIAAMVDRTRPDIAHAHNIYHHISPAIFPELRKAGVPTVMTLHDLKLACPAYTMRVDNAVCERCKGGRIYNVVLNRCIKGSVPLSTMIMLETALHRSLRIYDNNIDRFVVPSHFLINKLVEWGWKRERFLYVPNIVDCTKHHYDDQPGKSFTFFGRLSHEKGLTTLIEAAAIARQPITLVGTGQQEAELRKRASDRNADVTFLGYQTGKDLHAAIHNSRAIVLPSTWYENAPISILEAYALGRPVIGADIGGIPEMIRHGETGEVFQSGNAAGLADCLARFAAMPDAKVAEMGRSGRAWVEQDFSPKTYIEAITDLYAQLGAPTNNDEPTTRNYAS
ncbi:MAG: glycosyltransferase family 4 protein [Pseudomonadota bacterium]